MTTNFKLIHLILSTFLVLSTFLAGAGSLLASGEEILPNITGNKRGFQQFDASSQEPTPQMTPLGQICEKFKGTPMDVHLFTWPLIMVI